jgi:hypothetical protein
LSAAASLSSWLLSGMTSKSKRRLLARYVTYRFGLGITE